VTVLLVALGAAVGAPTRFFADRLIQRRTSSVFPWGTLTVNAVASLALGALVGAGITGNVAALAGTGFCGALSTYSTFGYETYRLIQDRSYLVALLNVAGSLAVTLAAASLGYWAASAVAG
jgi:CrcB protein